MSYSQSSCSGLFVCTAILCWDYHYLRYTFFNITNCTPKPIYLKTNKHLISRNNNYLKIQEKYSINGFICSNCSRENFLEYNFNKSNQCYKQITRIKLTNYCHYKKSQNICECIPSDQPIEPVKDWIRALVKPGKSHRNTIRVNNINKSASSFVYLLVGFILLLVLFGGIIGVIFYWIKLKSCQLWTLK